MTTNRRPRNTGSLYQQPGCSNWYVQYYRNGKAHRESTHTSNGRKAEKFLAARLAEVSTGNFFSPRIEKIKVSELADDLLLAYKTGVIRGQRSMEWAERRWKLHLKPFFADFRAVQVSTDLLNRYVHKRQAEEAENATINRELAFISKAFRLGVTSSPAKVRHVPPFPHLTENNVRKGFLADADYEKLADECAKVGLWLRTMLAVGWNFGWRKGEVLNLRVKQIDLPSRTIRLEQGTTKNNQGRIVKMTDEVYTLVAACIGGKKPDDYVFTRENGKRVKNFRKAWHNVCEAAGVPELLFHDLRRTGVRNLRRLGISEGVAMKISGHKTASVFRRYDITDESDLAEAAARLDEKRRVQLENRHNSDIIPDFAQFSGKHAETGG